MRGLGATKRKLQGRSIASFALLVTLFIHVAGIADDGRSQEPVATVGGESYVTLRSVLSHGERRIELARGDNKQTAYRFVLEIDAEQIEITPGPNDQIKIVQAGLEILSDQVMFRTNLEKLQIAATLAPEEHLDKRSPVIPFVEIADLHPGLDNQEVEMAFIINEEYLISGSVPVGNVASFGIEPQLKSGEPKLSVLVSGDCADALSRSGLGPDLNQAKGVIIQAVGRLVVVPPSKDRPNDQPTYQLRINDWKKCRVLSRKRPVMDNPPEFGPTIGPEIGPAANAPSPPMTCRILELLKPGPDDVEVSVGSNDGVKPGDRLDAIQDEVVIGKVEITQAQASRSIARIIEVVPGMALEQYQVMWNEMAQELKTFQGIWYYDVQEMWHWPAPIGLAMNSEGRASEQRWQVDVTKKQITWISQSAEPIYATFAIDPFKIPKEIDITIQSGPYKGITSRGIYELATGDKNSLRLCMSNLRVDAPRPTDVTSGSSLQQTMIGLHRIDPSEAITNENPLNRFQGEFLMELCSSVDQRLHGNQAELRDWRWKVSGSEILWTRRGEDWKLKIKVDGTSAPKAIDLTFESGPLKGQTWLGAYKWGGRDDNTLVMEFQHPGLDLPRPRDVALTSENRPLFIFLQPRPQTLVVNELNSLQGVWTLRNYDTGAWPLPGGKGPDKFGKGSELRWTVRGNEIAWPDENGTETKATFTIDTSFAPKHFDLTFVTGPHSGKVCKGIYQRGNVAQDMLWICITDPESSVDRPKFFSSKHDAGHSLLSLFPYRPKPPVGGKDLGFRVTVPTFDFKIGISEASANNAPIRLNIPSLQEAPLDWDGKNLQITEEAQPLQFDIGLVR